VLFFIELSTRRVEIAGIEAEANGLWISKIGRNLTDAVDGTLQGKRYLIHDRDPLFTTEFVNMLGCGCGLAEATTPIANLNAHPERFVRSIKESCLEGMILFGEGSMRQAVHEFVAHYRHERNHQGLANRLISPEGGHLAESGRGAATPAAGRHAELLLPRSGIGTKWQAVRRERFRMAHKTAHVHATKAAPDSLAHPSCMLLARSALVAQPRNWPTGEVGVFRPHGVAFGRVLHQLGPRSGARREVKKQRVARARRSIRNVARRLLTRVFQAAPARYRAAHRNPRFNSLMESQHYLDRPWINVRAVLEVLFLCNRTTRPEYFIRLRC